MGFRVIQYSSRKILFFSEAKIFKELKILSLFFLMHSFILLIESNLSALLNL